ncbi:hypothetical protein BD410DRAFT_134133 [Rickenella mellea]|uniref:Uncharacterized protein n=1 Tax=Rickenella mellea TaxID=50990 RepID=A0A4Y7Q8V3_9AGAM|nr:hypothetical protein BD410DRAFT_134133 [Rickenella mellea]
MSLYTNGHVGEPSSRLLSVNGKQSPRKAPPTRQLNGRKKSAASLRGAPTSLAAALGVPVDDGLDDGAVNGRATHSLADELAAALMPEPSAGQRMLAEEFGIEYEEEAADGTVEQATEVNGGTLAEELNSGGLDASNASAPPFDVEPPPADIDLATQFGSGAKATKEVLNLKPPRQKNEVDPMVALTRDLETTDKFLDHLRHLDSDTTGTSTFNKSGSGSSGTTAATEPHLERIAADMIRRINESARDREGQVRELLECEREFRKMAGEVGGEDLLGTLDELEAVEGLNEQSSSAQGVSPTVDSGKNSGKRDAKTPLETLQEEEEPVQSQHSQPRDRHRRQPSWNDWETDPDQHHLGDDSDTETVLPSPPLSPSGTLTSFPSFHIPSDSDPLTSQHIHQQPAAGPPSASVAIVHLANVRTSTGSLVTALTALSETAQVHSAAAAEAGRRLRALKNKLGGWRADWDAAERSRVRIEKWEAGIGDDVGGGGGGVGGKRVDGRSVVEEHLRAFEVALKDAGVKTQAIMAAS